MRNWLPEREAEITDAWGQEAARRLHEILNGEAETIPVSETLVQLRARIAKTGETRKTG